MTLEELARARPYALQPTVPEWTLGCFKRRCITFASGEEDTATEVIWIQSHGLTGDLRLPAGRPRPSAGSLEDSAAGDIEEWLRGDGFAAQTAWGYGQMSWDAFAAFQPYDKWPEPGRLERVGASLIEWAPSGVYVEDWRLQDGSSGLSAGLRLVSETGADGVERPREGALVIAGIHAQLVLGRRPAFEALPLNDQFAAAEDPTAFIRDAFEASVAYALAEDDEYVVRSAINPFLEGQPLFDPGAFSPGETEAELVQRGGGVTRRWKIDTLLADQNRSPATAATEAGLSWLAREHRALGL